MTLFLAIPSKGRLQELALAWLADAGLSMVQTRGARDYTASLAGIDGVAVSLISSADIADELIAGRVHLGITGEDLLAEHGAGNRVHSVERLGFGRANVIVAVPRAWIDVWTMADLDDVAASFHTRHHRKLRVATKYLTLARDFFLSHGIADYRIVESLGATEGAPAAGTAEVIVDITTTGATLAANDLKILDDGIILESQAALTASLRANWTTPARAAARALLDRIAARTIARSSQLICIERNLKTETVIAALTREFGASLLPGPDLAQASLLVPETNLQPAITRLRELCPGITFSTHKPAQIFTQGNGPYEKLEAQWPR